mgnify:FL=1
MTNILETLSRKFLAGTRPRPKPRPRKRAKKRQKINPWRTAYMQGQWDAEQANQETIALETERIKGEMEKIE